MKFSEHFNLIQETHEEHKRWTVLLEAKEPSLYYEEMFGKLDTFLPTDSRPIIRREVVAIIEMLGRNDRIVYFAPYIQAIVINQFITSTSYDVEDSLEPAFLKFQNKLTNKIKKRDGANAPIGRWNVLKKLKESIKHYFVDSKHITPIQQMNLSASGFFIDDLFFKLVETEKAFNDRVNKFLNPSVDDPKGAEVLFNFTDSKGVYYEWVDLNTNSCPVKEKTIMNHCGANDKASSMLSLRTLVAPETGKSYGITKADLKPLRIPVLTFAVRAYEGDEDGLELVESHGNSNQKPAKKYHEAIVELFKRDIIVNINQTGAYSLDQTFQLDDLSKELRKIADQHVGEEEADSAEFSAEIIEEADKYLTKINEGVWKKSGFNLKYDIIDSAESGADNDEARIGIWYYKVFGNMGVTDDEVKEIWEDLFDISSSYTHVEVSNHYSGGKVVNISVDDEESYITAPDGDIKNDLESLFDEMDEQNVAKFELQMEALFEDEDDFTEGFYKMMASIINEELEADEDSEDPDFEEIMDHVEFQGDSFVFEIPFYGNASRVEEVKDIEQAIYSDDGENGSKNWHKFKGNFESDNWEAKKVTSSAFKLRLKVPIRDRSFHYDKALNDLKNLAQDNDFVGFNYIR